MLEELSGVDGHAEFDAAVDDLRPGQVDERCGDLERQGAFHAGAHDQLGDAFEGSAQPRVPDTAGLESDTLGCL